MSVREFSLVCTIHGVVNRDTYPEINEIFGIDPPTKCPIDNGSNIVSHTVLREISETTTKIKEEDTPTKGFMKVMGYSYDVPAGTPGDVTRFEYITEEDMNVYEVNLLGRENNVDDTFDMYAGPTSAIGYLTQDVNINDTVVHLSSTALVYYKEGFTIAAGVPTAEIIGVIESLDPATGTATLRSASPIFKAQYMPVFLWVTRGVNVNIPPGISPLGNGKIGGSFCQKGFKVIFMYKNNSGLAKKFQMNSEITY
jgi:hypothetical protein